MGLGSSGAFAQASLALFLGSRCTPINDVFSCVLKGGDISFESLMSPIMKQVPNPEYDFKIN